MRTVELSDYLYTPEQEDAQREVLAEAMRAALKDTLEMYPEPGLRAEVVQAAVGQIATRTMIGVEDRAVRRAMLDSFCGILRASVLGPEEAVH